MKAGAANSLHPHTIDLRKALWPLVDARIAKVPQLEVDDDKLPVVRLTFPMTKREQRNVSLLVFDHSSAPDTEELWIREIGICSNVSKMSAWGFNLLPGPPVLEGTCFGSIKQFPLLDPKQRRVKLSTLVDDGHDPAQWICSGCYAMKGQYATDTPTVSMIAHTIMARRLLRAGQGKFADLMEQAILWVQRKSIGQYSWLKRATRGRSLEKDAHKVNDPAFFRLHDAGDFFSKAYLEEWFEIARRVARPRVFQGVTVPSVTIWAPTRVWSVDKGLGSKGCPTIEDLKCAPRNLVIRPSALHYGEAAPALREHGYAAGAASSRADFAKMAKWLCPAYSDPKTGGGAELAKGKLVGGNCARAQGPGVARGIEADDRAPRGHGCRVCWTYPELSVVYQEH